MKYLAKKDIRLKPRSKDSHKGDNGRVLVVGGSLDYIGAVLLAGIAAFRTGVDQVVVAAPEKAAIAINSFAPDMITKKFKGDFFGEKDAGEIISMSKSFDVVLIGNGIGLDDSAKKFCQKVIERVEGPKVIDADAVKVANLKRTKNAVFTPHQKELEILLAANGHSEISRVKDFKKRMERLQQLAGENVFLVKGAMDAVVSKDRIVFNRTGNEGMTVGGTGDVLAGIAAGLLATEKDPFRAAACAAYISGEVGDELKKGMGYGFMASDMVNLIPEIMKRHWR